MQYFFCNLFLYVYSVFQQYKKRVHLKEMYTLKGQSL